MKKALLFVLSAMLLLLPVACSPNPAGASSPPESKEEEWQPDSITLTIPYKAGGGMENMRTFAKYWEKYLGCEIVVDNRAGANGQVGTTYFTSLPADGTNVLANAELYFSYSCVVQKAEYSPDDFRFMNLHEVDPCALILSAGSKFTSFDELNAYIKENPGVIKLGCATGGSTMILTEMLKEKLGWDVKTVLYDGGSDLKTATLGGHVDIAVSTVSTANESGLPVVLVDAKEPVVNHEDAVLTAEVLGETPQLGSVRWFAVRKEVAEDYPKRFEKLMESMEQTYSDPEFLAEVANLNKQDFISFSGSEAATQRIRYYYDLAAQYRDALQATAAQ